MTDIEYDVDGRMARVDSVRLNLWRRMTHRHRFEVIGVEEHLAKRQGMYVVTCGSYACYGLQTERCRCGATRQNHACWEQEHYL